MNDNNPKIKRENQLIKIRKQHQDYYQPIEMIKTKYFSWKLNNLAAGCNQCILGRKLVVFVTGICPKDCFYCPLSEQKKNNDVIFANERPLRDEDDIDALIDEAALSKSWGAGFTGGDPLAESTGLANILRY